MEDRIENEEMSSVKERRRGERKKGGSATL